MNGLGNLLSHKVSKLLVFGVRSPADNIIHATRVGIWCERYRSCHGSPTYCQAPIVSALVFFRLHKVSFHSFLKPFVILVHFHGIRPFLAETMKRIATKEWSLCTFVIAIAIVIGFRMENIVKCGGVSIFHCINPFACAFLHNGQDIRKFLGSLVVDGIGRIVEHSIVAKQPGIRNKGSQRGILVSKHIFLYFAKIHRVLDNIVVAFGNNRFCKVQQRIPPFQCQQYSIAGNRYTFPVQRIAFFFEFLCQNVSIVGVNRCFRCRGTVSGPVALQSNNARTNAQPFRWGG
mmetsp:Transcript_17160/g.47198  ORF Transcript_17160/g.47198 Transcript_17160/m.47198 type:complete len:289 (+) Transcript_17160:410-1276(+)